MFFNDEIGIESMIKAIYYYPWAAFNISQAEKGDVNVYQTFCRGTCRDITVRLTYNRGGDADMYTKEGSPPNAASMNTSRCDDCICKSVNSNSPDFCAVTTNGNKLGFLV